MKHYESIYKNILVVFAQLWLTSILRYRFRRRIQEVCWTDRRIEKTQGLDIETNLAVGLLYRSITCVNTIDPHFSERQPIMEQMDIPPDAGNKLPDSRVFER